MKERAKLAKRVRSHAMDELRLQSESELYVMSQGLRAVKSSYSTLQKIERKREKLKNRDKGSILGRNRLGPLG